MGDVGSLSLGASWERLPDHEAGGATVGGRQYFCHRVRSVILQVGRFTKGRPIFRMAPSIITSSSRDGGAQDHREVLGHFHLFGNGGHFDAEAEVRSMENTRSRKMSSIITRVVVGIYADREEDEMIALFLARSNQSLKG